MRFLLKKFLASTLGFTLAASLLAVLPIILTAESSAATTLDTLRFPRNKVASIYNTKGDAPMDCYKTAGTCGGVRTAQYEQVLPAGGYFQVFAYPNPTYRVGLSICGDSSCTTLGNANIYGYKQGEYFLLRIKPSDRKIKDYLLVFSLGNDDPYLRPIGSTISWTFDGTSGREGAYASAPGSASASITGVVREGSTLTGSQNYTGVDVVLARQWKRSDYYRPLSNVGGTDIPGATSETYTLTADDVGKWIRYTVKLRNMQGSDSVFGVRTEYILVEAAPKEALNPVLTESVPFLGGFNFRITNYDSSFNYSASVTGGTVTLGTASGTTLPVTVSGLSSAQNVRVTITTTKTGYPQGSATVSGASITSAITSSTGPIGRWISSSIAQVSGRMIVANQGGYLYTSTDNGVNWNQLASIRNWSSVAQSDNGATIFATVAGGRIQKSTNSGATWIEVASVQNWRSIACDSDCSVVLASVSGGKLWRSLDSGASWSEAESIRNWRSVALSANGEKMLALAYNSVPYFSTNSGATWSASPVTLVSPKWVSGAISSDGNTFFAAPDSGLIAYSRNSGTTWESYVTRTNTASISYAKDVNMLMHCGIDGSIAISATAGTTVERVIENQAPWSSCSISANGEVLLATSNTGLIYTSTDGGSNWITRSISSGNVNRRALVTSENGNQIYTAVYGGKIEYSEDSGKTWRVSADIVQNWIGIASSNSFQKIYAIGYQGFLYRSVDSGVTWAQVSLPSLPWISIATSADGSKIVAAAKGGNIYTSANSGDSWSSRDAKRKWVSVTSSSSGNNLAAVVEGGFIYTSENGGLTWTQRGTSRNWSAIASSSSGDKLVATVAQGQIYTSTNAGVTWTARGSSRNWLNVVSSTSGNKLIAVVGTGKIYTSSNSGATWTPRESARNWRALVITGNGNRAYAADFGKKLYRSGDSGETWTVL